MKKIFVINLLTLLTLSACAAQAVQTEIPPTIIIVPSPTESHLRTDLFPTQLAVVTVLSQTTGVPPEQIIVASTEAVDWPDGCLGVVRMGVMCTQAIVPGYRMILKANGKQYEFRTNLDGSVILPVEGPPVSGSAQDAATNQLATNLGVQKNEVTLISSSPVQWNDSCLGVGLEGVMCAQGAVNGYLIVLETGGHQYEYHTNGDGSRIMPATPAMDWSEQGGIAGVCGNITVYLSGEVYGYGCAENASNTMKTLVNLLSPEQRMQFYTMIDTYSMSVIDLSDPEGVSDRMIRQTDWFGKGDRTPTAKEQQMLFALGKTIYEGMQK